MLRYRSSTITVSSLPLRLAQVFQPANAPLSSMAETAVAGQPYRGSRERRQRSSATPRAASAGHALSGQDLHRPVGRRRRPYDRRSLVTAEGLPLGLAAVKFWTREKFKGTAALNKKTNPTRVPTSTSCSVRQRSSLKLRPDAIRPLAPLPRNTAPENES
jgi:hypothetical protein